MALAQKFLFDISFDAPGSEARQRGAITPAEPHFTRTELQAAAATARAEGHAAGMEEAVSQHDRRLADALASIGEKVAALLADTEAARRAAERDAIELTRTITAKLFPMLVRRGAVEEIAAIVTQCMRETMDEPRLVLRVHDSIFPAAQQRIASLAGSTGWPGKLIILADEALGAGDCRVEWADGGVERDTARTRREIDDIITRAVSALEENLKANPDVGSGT